MASESRSVDAAAALEDARLLTMVAAGVPLGELLETPAHDVEAIIGGAGVAIMVTRRRHLSLCTAPSLPPGFARALDGCAIGEGQASAGAAAFRRAPVIVEDLCTDPVFDAHRALALAFDLHGAWSFPIIGGPEGSAIGTFDVYFTSPRSPRASDLSLLTRAAALAAVAIERDQREERLRELERIESIGRLSAGIAHDFNNILSVVTICGNMLKERLHGDDLELITEIVEAASRGANLTAQILAYGRRQVLRPEALDLNRVIRGIEPLLRRAVAENIGIRLSLAPELWEVQADPGQIEQVVVNLVANARDAMPGGGMLTIETTNVDATDLALQGPFVRLAVTDTGAGMDQQTCKRVFEPFFAATESTKSQGLGLAIVQGIVQQSGGDVSAHSQPEVGTTFEVYLPRSAMRPVARAPAAAPPLDAKHAELNILVVEDDPSLRKAFALSLQSMAFHAQIVGTAHEALELTAHGFTPDLVVTDTVLPGMNGKQLAHRLREQLPALRVLYTSGYPDVTIATQGVLETGTQFLAKPFTLRGLADAIAQAMRPAA